MKDPFARFGVTKPTQLITKSDQWFQEVQFLFRHHRYMPVLYLGGFVIECLLKANLWRQRFDAGIGQLVHRSHDLPGLLLASATLSGEIEKERTAVHMRFIRLSSWNVRIRYNPKRVTRVDAQRFMMDLLEVRLWLRNRI